MLKIIKPSYLLLLGFVVVISVMLNQIAVGKNTPVEKSPSLDQAIGILNEARLSFKSIQDYECRLIKTERINGVLLPQGTMTMKVRNNPLSIYLRSESPIDEKGLEVCYIDGRNRGMMRVHPTGWLSILGFLSLNPRDPRALQKSRHSITEAGLGNLLECTSKYWELEKQLNKTIVQITDENLEGYTCTRIDTFHPERNAGNFYGYHCILWLDKKTLLPIGAETYDWPQSGGIHGGDLLEKYRFLNTQCNVGLSDKTFSH